MTLFFKTIFLTIIIRRFLFINNLSRKNRRLYCNIIYALDLKHRCFCIGKIKSFYFLFLKNRKCTKIKWSITHLVVILCNTPFIAIAIKDVDILLGPKDIPYSIICKINGRVPVNTVV